MLSDAAKEVKFVAMLMKTMGIDVKIPITVRVDNVAAIFMAETANSSNRTRHVDICYHFIREYVEDEFIRIKFVTTDKNLADMFTKNTNKKVHSLHKEKMIAPMPITAKNE